VTSSPSSSSSFDIEQFKITQRRRWDSVAPGWKEWWETFEIAAQKVNDRLIELAEIKPRQKVFDIATGVGEPAVTGARRLVAQNVSFRRIGLLDLVKICLIPRYYFYD
jgi:hypothetical protein